MNLYVEFKDGERHLVRFIQCGDTKFDIIQENNDLIMMERR